MDKLQTMKSLQQTIKQQGLPIYRQLTNPLRLQPSFIIIGAQKCGTTTCYHSLVQHPDILPSKWKELHFFDNRFSRGINWYRYQFPICFRQSVITGEASPYYIYHPHSPKRIATYFPHVKLIVLLRNPIDRAYSNYNHQVDLGYEKLAFEEAIDREEERLKSEIERMLKDENYYSFNHQHYSYLGRGIYINQLKVWFSLFPQEQFLILHSKDLFAQTQATFNKVLNFLNLPDWEYEDIKTLNQRSYPQLEPKLRTRLRNYFQPYNEKLYDFLGIDFGWN